MWVGRSRGPLLLAAAVFGACSASDDTADRARADRCTDAPQIEVAADAFGLVVDDRNDADHAIVLTGAFDRSERSPTEPEEFDFSAAFEGGNPFDEPTGLHQLIGRDIDLRASVMRDRQDVMIVVVESERDLADVTCALAAWPAAGGVDIRRAVLVEPAG